MENKFKYIVEEHYNNYNEDERFNFKSNYVEFLTTVKYIKKYAPKGCRILEIGAGTGRYSIYLAKEGYNITAVELVKSNLKVLRKNAKGIKNLRAYEGDALNLSFLKDNSFDVVLNLGPMYHLYDEASRMQAIDETIRVAKPSGIIMFAYLTHASIVASYGVRRGKLPELQYCLNKDGSLQNVPEEIFSSYYIEEFNKQFENKNTKFIKNVATDGIAGCMKDYVNEMDNKNFKLFLKWHLATCERADQQGLSSHMLYICKKLKKEQA